ncbi:hypothetical protein [Caldimonas sp. KR1-144]|uniref:hypothetical protein n=1 Tax=Caldimonas sp. KR1-144 TaxID=3400911 RepID=UPI003C023AD6
MNEVQVPVAVVDGQIQVQEVVDLTKKPKDVKIRWILSTPGWEFTANGIVIENPSPQFSESQRTASGSEFQWKDKNDDSKTYKYDVNVQAAGGSGPVISLDPTINNGDGGG